VSVRHVDRSAVAVESAFTLLGTQISPPSDLHVALLAIRKQCAKLRSASNRADVHDICTDRPEKTTLHTTADRAQRASTVVGLAETEKEMYH
jgi:hypothetical protein